MFTMSVPLCFGRGFSDADETLFKTNCFKFGTVSLQLVVFSFWTGIKSKCLHCWV